MILTITLPLPQQPLAIGHMPHIQKIAAFSILVALTVLTLKLVAWRVTGSIALFSEATECLVNLTSATSAFVAIRIASRPADTRHPYGHHKAEFISAMLGGSMIFVAGLFIMNKAAHGLLDPQTITAPYQGIAFTVMAGVINAGWCYVLMTQGRKLRSPALQADGRHLLSDVLFSSAVILGVLATALTGWAALDPLMAAIVAVNILRSGGKVVLGAVHGLMDEALPEADLDRIRAIVRAEGDGALQMHNLRTRHAGPATFVDFNLVMPGSMTVARSHTICARIETALKATLPGCIVSIRVEPEEQARRQGRTLTVIDGGGGAPAPDATDSPPKSKGFP